MSEVTPVAATPATPSSPATPSASTTLSQPAAQGKTPVTAKAPVAPTKGEKTPGQEGVPGTPEKEDFFELVVDGEKRQLTREQAVRQLQKAHAADKRFREAQELTRKNQTLLQMLKEDPESALEQLGLDVDAITNKRVARQAERAMMTPEQLEKQELQQKLEQYESKEKQRQEAEAKAKQEEQDKVVFSRIEKGFLSAAERHGLDGTPENLGRMVEIASEALDLGVPITEDQIISELREREDSAFGKLEKRVLGGLKGEALAKRLGPTVVEEVLKWSVERLRGQAGQPKTPPAESTENSKNVPQYVQPDQFLKKHGF